MYGKKGKVHKGEEEEWMGGDDLELIKHRFSRGVDWRTSEKNRRLFKENTWWREEPVRQGWCKRLREKEEKLIRGRRENRADSGWNTESGDRLTVRGTGKQSTEEIRYLWLSISRSRLVTEALLNTIASKSRPTLRSILSHRKHKMNKESSL